MHMPPRFFVPDLRPPAPVVSLPPEEGHHLARVLRLREGDDVRVFDGRGTEFAACVASIVRDTVTVKLLGPIVTPPPAAVPLTLAQGVLKGDAMDDVVRDAAMVGVAVLQPLITANTTVKAAWIVRARERWARIALASAKQCGRSWLPEIREPLPLESWLERPDGRGFLLVEPAFAGRGVLRLADVLASPRPAAASLLVGPEGGWTAAEHAHARAAGFSPLSLGRLTLRADAAPTIAAAALLALWEG